MPPETVTEFFKIIDAMAEGEVVIIRLSGDTPKTFAYHIYTNTLARFADVFNQMGPTRFLGAISLAARPGAGLFWVTLEHTWFDPDGPDEVLFTSAWTRWCGEIWSMGFVPTGLAWTLEAAAQRTKMRLVAGCPVVMDCRGSHQFPIPWIFSIENEASAPMYHANADATRLMNQGSVSPQEWKRRITTAERAMYRDEAEEIRRIYRAKGIDPGK